MFASNSNIRKHHFSPALYYQPIVGKICTVTNPANSITHIHACDADSSWIVSFGVTLSDQSLTKFDNYYKLNSVFEVAKTIRIIKIDTIFHNSNNCINNLVFYFSDGTKKQLGPNHSKAKVETLVLADNEHVCGVEVEHGTNYVIALTWITARQL